MIALPLHFRTFHENTVYVDFFPAVWSLWQKRPSLKSVLWKDKGDKRKLQNNYKLVQFFIEISKRFENKISHLSAVVVTEFKKCWLYRKMTSLSVSRNCYHHHVQQSDEKRKRLSHDGHDQQWRFCKSCIYSGRMALLTIVNSQLNIMEVNFTSLSEAENEHINLVHFVSEKMRLVMVV